MYRVNQYLWQCTSLQTPTRTCAATIITDRQTAPVAGTLLVETLKPFAPVYLCAAHLPLNMERSEVGVGFAVGNAQRDPARRRHLGLKVERRRV